MGFFNYCTVEWWHSEYLYLLFACAMIFFVIIVEINVSLWYTMTLRWTSKLIMVLKVLPKRSNADRYIMRQYHQGVRLDEIRCMIFLPQIIAINFDTFPACNFRSNALLKYQTRERALTLFPVMLICKERDSGTGINSCWVLPNHHDSHVNFWVNC